MQPHRALPRRRCVLQVEGVFQLQGGVEKYFQVGAVALAPARFGGVQRRGPTHACLPRLRCGKHRRGCRRGGRQAVSAGGQRGLTLLVLSSQAFPDGGHWKGLNYVFDKREAFGVDSIAGVGGVVEGKKKKKKKGKGKGGQDDDGKVLGKCCTCGDKWERQVEPAMCGLLCQELWRTPTPCWAAGSAAGADAASDQTSRLVAGMIHARPPRAYVWRRHGGRHKVASSPRRWRATSGRCR